ncbi:MAG TPA: glycosyltransferase family 4 protein, partial [Actinokineospora sp.]|nr:glycosyltransferase family 4 protein [Actinokineospora sp.]
MAEEFDVRPRVLLLNWRDLSHPEGGGSERYVEAIGTGLAARGYRVTIQCAEHDGAAGAEWVSGVRFRRRGHRLSVYLWAFLAVLRSDADIIVDVQNGMPFFARLVARCPVIVLVHHVHREQWRTAVGPVAGRVGWWIESWLAPRLFRGCRYIAVSEVTRRELNELGVGLERTAVVPNGLDVAPVVAVERADTPRLVAVSRLVPHKRIEHAIDTLVELADQWPDMVLDVVGCGYWSDNLREYANAKGVGHRVVMHGWVDERRKHELLAAAWVHLLPSVKEGWGIVIMEAAAHGVPSIAYRAAGGVAESIVDTKTGLLANDFDEFVAHTRRLLTDHVERAAMGAAGRAWAEGFGWPASVTEFESILRDTAHLSTPRPRVL